MRTLFNLLGHKNVGLTFITLICAPFFLLCSCDQFDQCLKNEFRQEPTSTSNSIGIGSLKWSASKDQFENALSLSYKSIYNIYWLYNYDYSYKGQRVTVEYEIRPKYYDNAPICLSFRCSNDDEVNLPYTVVAKEVSKISGIKKRFESSVVVYSTGDGFGNNAKRYESPSESLNSYLEMLGIDSDFSSGNELWLINNHTLIRVIEDQVYGHQIVYYNLPLLYIKKQMQ